MADQQGERQVASDADLAAVPEGHHRWIREQRGQAVREAWTGWAQEQPAPKPSWLVPWHLLDVSQRDVDMRIGDAVVAPALGLLAAVIEALEYDGDATDHESLVRAAEVRGVLRSVIETGDFESGVVTIRELQARNAAEREAKAAAYRENERR